MKLFGKFCTFLLFFSSAALIGGCGEKSYRTDSGMIWNTTYNITYESDRDLGDSIMAELRRVGASLNVFDSNSLTGRVNAAMETEVDSAFMQVYAMSRRIWKMSGGMFDPTLGPLIKAWGFGPGHQATSDTLRIDSLLRFTGIGKTRLENGKLIKDDVRTNFNFSAIAKGYGCDRVAETLRRNGVENYLVEIGGEIAAGGKSPRGGEWNVAIDRPVHGATADNRQAQGVIGITGKGVATSGNYRNFHQQKGRYYGHTISAATGRPVETDVISATVVAPSCMEADGLATAMMAMGSAKGRHLADSLGLPVMLILRDSTEWMSAPFRKLLR